MHRLQFLPELLTDLKTTPTKSIQVEEYAYVFSGLSSRGLVAKHFEKLSTLCFLKVR